MSHEKQCQMFQFACGMQQFFQFSPLTDWVIGGGHDRRLSRDPLPVFSARGHCKQFWHGQGYPLFDVVHPAFPLPTTELPTLQGALKDGVGQAVKACDMPKPCTFPSLDSCKKRFLWTHTEVNFALHSTVGLLLHVGEAEQFPQELVFESLDPFFFQSESRVHVLQL